MSSLAHSEAEGGFSIPGQSEAAGGGWKCSGCGIDTPRRVRACDCPTNCVYRGEPGRFQHDTKTRAANSPGEIVDADGVVEQLAVHKKTHTQWAEWFEAHPEEAAKQPDLGDAAFHRAVEAKYDAMIRVVSDLARSADTQGEGEPDETVRDQSPAIDTQDLRDLISDAIGDSMDMDWTYSDGARSIIRAFEREGLVVMQSGASKAAPDASGYIAPVNTSPEPVSEPPENEQVDS